MSKFYKTDVVIVGAGPVGLFAVFELGMLKIKSHVVDTLDFVGGQCTALYPEKPIYDIAGFPEISAKKLIENLKKQAEPFNADYHLGNQVVKINKDGNTFTVTTSKDVEIECKAILIAAGCGAFGPNRPPLDGIEDYEKTGCVAYMIQKKEIYRNKDVVIAGGGDSAVDWALSLVDIASSVSVVHRRPKFRCAPDSAEKLGKLADDGRINMVIPYQLSSLKGGKGELEEVVVKDLDGNEKNIKADILLPFYGLSMELGPIADWGLGLDKSHIEVDQSTLETNIEGIFAIGDINTYKGKLKLITCGFSEAAMAAHSIYPFIHDEALHFEYSTSKGIK